MICVHSLVCRDLIQRRIHFSYSCERATLCKQHSQFDVSVVFTVFLFQNIAKESVNNPTVLKKYFYFRIFAIYGAREYEYIYPPLDNRFNASRLKCGACQEYGVTINRKIVRFFPLFQFVSTAIFLLLWLYCFYRYAQLTKSDYLLGFVGVSNINAQTDFVFLHNRFWR